MIVYDVTDEESFKNISEWINNIVRVSDNTVMPYVL